MVKKNREKTSKKTSPVFSKYLLIGGVLVLVLVISIFSEDRILSMGKFMRRFYPTPTPTPSPIVLEIVTSSASFHKDKYVELAINDLADKLKININNIKVISVESHNYPDTSMGCPQKGKLYAQVIIPGFIIKLEVLNKQYTYNGGLDKVVNCKS